MVAGGKLLLSACMYALSAHIECRDTLRELVNSPLNPILFHPRPNLHKSQYTLLNSNPTPPVRNTDHAPLPPSIPPITLPPLPNPNTHLPLQQLPQRTPIPQINPLPLPLSLPLPTTFFSSNPIISLRPTNRATQPNLLIRRLFIQHISSLWRQNQC